MKGKSLNISVALWFVAGVLFLFLAFDGHLHWDEPAYLYTGGYLDLNQILEGEFQPSGIEGFYLSRILHVLLIHGVAKSIGLGMGTLAVLQILYLLLLFAYSYVMYLILKALLPNAEGLVLAVGISMFTPMYLYFAFKTLPEIPALLLTAVAMLGLLRLIEGRGTRWLVISALSLTGAALFKNNMILLYLSGIVVLPLFKQRKYSLRRMGVHSFVIGIFSLLLFFIVLTSMGIGVRDYLATFSELLEDKEPLISLLIHSLIENGIFLLALPMAFFSGRKAAGFFASWYLMATLPIVLTFESVEARYLAPNLVPLTGLIYLSLKGLKPRIVTWWRHNRSLTVTVSFVGLVFVLSSNAFALAIMSHEVRIDQLHRILTYLDTTYGQKDYAILIPWTYTDFHYLRFVYPDREVYNVMTVDLFEARSRENKNRLANAESYYSERVIRTPEELASLNTTLIYLGFEESFSVANLRTIVHFFPGVNLDNLFAKMNFVNHLSLSWLWENPQFSFSNEIQYGHYIAYEIEMDP